MAASVAVLGGGIVGVSCALELQRLGFEVTLLDRQDPGKETSYGNAGVLARSSLMPMNNPGLWKLLPKLLTNRTASLRYNIPFLVENMGWALRFLASMRRSVFEETTAALNSLIVSSTREHLRLMKEADALGRLTESGWIFLYRSEDGFSGSALNRSEFDRHGVSYENLGPGELRDLEPSLNPIFRKAIWIKDAKSVNSPGGLVEAYARLFASRNGRIEKLDVSEVREDGDAWVTLSRSGERRRTDRVVVALGPWAPEILRRMKIRVPMGFERGYHMHYAALGNARLGRPIYDTGGGYVMSPMEQGIRLTTGSELNFCDARKNPAQLGMAEQAAREAFPLGERLEGEPWMGRRPTMPDSRPVIGEMRGRPGLWLAFGHQHIGFSTGPGTARLLGELMTGATPNIDPKPFRPQRFLS